MIRQKMYVESSVSKAARDRILAALDARDLELARREVEALAPVSSPSLPTFIGSGRVEYVDVVDSSIGFLGGILRAAETRDDDRRRTDAIHRAFERFAQRFTELYAADLDELEQEWAREAAEAAEAADN